MADAPEKKSESQGDHPSPPVQQEQAKKEASQESSPQPLITEVQKKIVDKPKIEVTPSNHKRNEKLWLFTGLLLIVGVSWLLLWIFYLQYHQWTDDAYSNGNMINVNSAVPGSVVAIYADDTDF